MKGKHGQSASTRREYQEIEAKLAAETKRADDLNAMHLREMSTWLRKMDALRRENEVLRQQVVEVTSEKTQQAERTITQQETKIAALRGDLVVAQKVADQCRDLLIDQIRKMNNWNLAQARVYARSLWKGIDKAADASGEYADAWTKRAELDHAAFHI